MKKAKWIAALFLSVAMLTACGDSKEEVNQPVSLQETIMDVSKEEPKTEESAPVESEPEETEQEVIVDEPPMEGVYRSELTGMWISEELRNQRPIAAMVDNEKKALDHYGVNQADIVYELMNSTANERVTRLMVIMKDYEKITQLGSIRSVRPTNFLLAAEYNAIILHDGGPWMIDEYAAKKYSTHLSGDFARFSNGKPSEFTEYVTYEDYKNPTTGKSYSGLKKRIERAKIETEYNSYYPGQHFKFNTQGVDLTTNDICLDANTIRLPFPHNKSELGYNVDTKTYDYYEYGMPHIDALDGRITSFKNVIIQRCKFFEYDNHGYMMFNVVGDGVGYYATEGKLTTIRWKKDKEDGLTVYTLGETGKEIELNVGNTYICLVPDDNWDNLKVE